MEIKAQLNYLHIAPRKVRLVTDLLKDMSVVRARIQLEHLPKRSAAPLLRLLQSAVANAKHNFQIEDSGLHIKKVIVNPGPVLKRFEPRAFGRAAPIRKRSSHVLLVLETEKVKTGGRKKVRKEGPAIREATIEDMEKIEEKTPRFGVERSEVRPGLKPKSAGFVRRVFRRKAI
ncbi:MAG: 50S ribosomal protein L22 [Candidatus Sungbacteria bacterium]|nr:50S ribosomal protein L22 [Candidatus Sungbacteria bacterium]